MIEIKFSGFESLEQVLMEAVREHLREQIGSIRHPQTGEFPSVSITPGADGNMNIQVEGSPELVALVQARLQADDDAEGSHESEPADDEKVDGAVARASNHTSNTRAVPKAFLSYTAADRALAEKIASALMVNGIDTWWDQWCINSGESIRRKVEEGIGDCTHFIVLLTPRSIVMPWVQEEIDAAFTRKLGAGIKLIPLRCDLPANEMPLLLQSQLSPTVDAEAIDILQLVNDIHGMSRKPALGRSPAVAPANGRSLAPYSSAANALAKMMVEDSPLARKFEPFLSYDDAAVKTGLTVEDVRDAVHELMGMVSDHHGQRFYAEEELFVRLDAYWKPWDPAKDAVTVAAVLLNGSISGEPGAIAKALGWSARRLNPALSYLENRGHVKAMRNMSGSDFVLVTMFATDGTRRFVKSRQQHNAPLI